MLVAGPLCAQPDLNLEDVAFTSALDRTEQKYVLRLPASFDAGESHDVLIALHAHGSDRWQFVKDDRDECRAARDVAAEHDMILVVPDYRAKTSWMGPKAESDVVQIIGDLKKKYRVSRVFLCGASMGGAASLTFAALHPDLINGVASMNGTANLLEYENFQGAISASFGDAKDQIPNEYKKRSAAFWPEKLTMPIAFPVSGKDTAVPPQSVLRLAEVLKARGHQRMKLVYRPEMGHATNYKDARTILEFLLQDPETVQRNP